MEQIRLISLVSPLADCTVEGGTYLTFTQQPSYNLNLILVLSAQNTLFSWYRTNFRADSELSPTSKSPSSKYLKLYLVDRVPGHGPLGETKGANALPSI